MVNVIYLLICLTFNLKNKPEKRLKSNRKSTQNFRINKILDRFFFTFANCLRGKLEITLVKTAANVEHLCQDWKHPRKSVPVLDKSPFSRLFFM